MMYAYLYHHPASYLALATASVIATAGLIRSDLALVFMGGGLALLLNLLPLILNATHQRKLFPSINAKLNKKTSPFAGYSLR